MTDESNELRLNQFVMVILKGYGCFTSTKCREKVIILERKVMYNMKKNFISGDVNIKWNKLGANLFSFMQLHSIREIYLLNSIQVFSLTYYASTRLFHISSGKVLPKRIGSFIISNKWYSFWWKGCNHGTTNKMVLSFIDLDSCDGWWFMSGPEQIPWVGLTLENHYWLQVNPWHDLLTQRNT